MFEGEKGWVEGGGVESGKTLWKKTSGRGAPVQCCNEVVATTQDLKMFCQIAQRCAN